MRLAFAGTPAFAAVSLQALLRAGHDVALVLTQPDRPAGRGLKLQPSAVKQVALQHALQLQQPRGLRLDGRFAQDAQQAREALESSAAQALVVVAYGLILPAWLLQLPPLGCLNVHASLLPRWRGAAPIQRAIEAGDTQTGVCIMRMEAGLDTGPVLRAQAEAIYADDSAASLHDRLAERGAQLLLQCLLGLQRGQEQEQAQPDQGVSYAHKIDKSEARIEWREPAAQIERRLRAFDPFPGCSFDWRGETVKLWRAAVEEPRLPVPPQPGQVLSAAPGSLVVACGDGRALRCLSLQRPGGRRLEAASFIGSLGSDAPGPGELLGGPQPMSATPD